jgi:hypothetical protein
MARLITPLLSLFLTSQLAFGAPAGLKKASIEEMSGDVIVKKQTDTIDRKAILKESITGKDIIRTGKKSRAELEFEDQSICRLGSNTIFSFDPQTRDMAFSRGVALVHVPPGKGGARIATPAATAAIQGDTLVVRATVMPDGTPATQFTALSPRGGPTDGNIVVTLNNNPNASFRLEGGQVAIVPANATSLSQIPRAEIDVGTFAAKSPILQDLPPTAKQEVNIVTVNQNALFDSGLAQRTEYAIVGDQVVKADANGNFLPPPPTPLTTTTATAPAPTGTIMPDGTVIMPDGTMISPDGTVTKTDGTTFTSTTLADGTQVMPDGTTVSPDGTITKTDGTTYTPTTTTSGTTTYSGTTYTPPEGTKTYTAPDGTTMTYDGGTTYSGTPTTTFFTSDQPLTSTFSTFQTTLAQVIGVTAPATPPHPPFIVPYSGIFDFSVNASAIFNTGTGEITGLAGITLANMGINGKYNFGKDDVLGVSQFSFNTLAIGQNITVVGPYALQLHTINNTGVGTPLQISNSTITFSGTGPSSIEMVTDFSGSIVHTGTLTAENGNVRMLAPSGSVTAGAIVTSGTDSSTGTTGGNGGNISLGAPSGTVTLNGTLTANGGNNTGTGSGGNAGSVNIQASTITFAGNDILANGGDSVISTTTAGKGGTISIGTPNALATVANVEIQANGGSSGTGTDGAGGNITLSGNSISVPTSTTSPITAMGSGPGADGGSVLLKSATTIDLTQSSNQTIINTSGGAGGAGGTIALNSASPVTITDSNLTVPKTLDAGAGGTISIPAGVAAGSTYNTNP